MEDDIPVFGGEQYRPLVHVADAVTAYVAALETPKKKVDHHTFNVGDNHLNYQIKKVGHIIEEEIDDAEGRFLDYMEDERTYRVSFDKINYLLGWEAEYNIADGVTEIADWMAPEDVID